MTSPVKITIHKVGNGLCALTARDTDGLTVSFDDGVVKEQHLSWKAFKQILSLRTTQQAALLPSRPAPVAAAVAPPASVIANPAVKPS